VPARLIWSKLAREALLEIYVAVSLENPTAAERLYDRIESRVSALASQPRMGQRRPDVSPDARVLVQNPYLILYQTYPADDESPVLTVEIVAVVDGRRDLEALR
jgi:toxin ParE1/3/4